MESVLVEKDEKDYRKYREREKLMDHYTFGIPHVHTLYFLF